MTKSIIGIWFADPPTFGLDVQKSIKHPVQMFKDVVRYKANPRSSETMKRMFTERFPAGNLVEFDLKIINQADEVVLLYPDAIGLGWGKAERKIRQQTLPNTLVSCLNGRGRYFILARRTQVSLRLRRMLEKTLLVEFLSSVVFVILTPILFSYDFVCRRT
jgi:hypothetical protein